MKCLCTKRNAAISKCLLFVCHCSLQSLGVMTLVQELTVHVSVLIEFFVSLWHLLPRIDNMGKQMTVFPVICNVSSASTMLTCLCILPL